ncbi:MAG: DUF92 domain-containing protein [Bacteroidota bacterium]
MLQLPLGFLLAVLVALAARRAHSLSRGGAYAAAAVGTVVFGVGGWPWAILLLAFFISSSGLSRAFTKRKAGLEEKFSKGHERDAGQVFGNGAVAAVFAGLHGLYPTSIWPWLGFAAALAAVNADTWATELGVLNPGAPRLLTNLRERVEKGTSGGVSPWGTAAALLGSGLIAVLAVLLSPLPGVGAGDGLLITAAGLAGSLFDSLLGATVQAIYYCPSCKKETERHPVHTCGTPTTQVRGWSWLNNDWVNFACGAMGAAVALALQRLL